MCFVVTRARSLVRFFTNGTRLEASSPQEKRINMLLSGLGSARIVKNYDLGLENAARGRRPRAAFSRPRSQFFPSRTSQPANNIYVLKSYVLSNQTRLRFYESLQRSV